MLMKTINKKVLVGELVLKNVLVFLVEIYLKLVLANSRKIHYYKVNFCNICIEIYRICMKLKAILDKEIIELVC